MTKITPELLLQAYKIGVFPMANNQADPTIEFFDPDPRGIIPLELFHVPRSLRKLIRKGEFYVTYNTAFSSVLSACANITVNRPTTWINEEIKVLYQKLFDMGYCHSIEVWCDDNIVGGLYGVSIGAAFFGESMFSLKPNSSKIALVHLVASLKQKGFYCWIVNLPMSISFNLEQSVFGVTSTKYSLPTRLIKPRNFLPSLVN